MPDDDYEPCPDPRCNDCLGAAPMPQCVTAVYWAEQSDLEPLADVTKEAADVLFVLLSILRTRGIAWGDVVDACREKVADLKTKPHYAGEQFAEGEAMTEPATPQLTETEVAEIEARMNKTPEGPWFAVADAAKECGPHRDSGLALVDTGRESDWSIARLCEWHQARFIAHSREDMAALIRDWRALQARIAQLDWPDGELRCNEPRVTATSGARLREKKVATAMRDLCVERVKGMRDEWDRDGALLRTMSLTVKAEAASEIITALQSLTLDQVESKVAAK